MPPSLDIYLPAPTWRSSRNMTTTKHEGKSTGGGMEEWRHVRSIFFHFTLAHITTVFPQLYKVSSVPLKTKAHLMCVSAALNFSCKVSNLWCFLFSHVHGEYGWLFPLNFHYSLLILGINSWFYSACDFTTIKCQKVWRAVHGLFSRNETLDTHDKIA